MLDGLTLALSTLPPWTLSRVGLKNPSNMRQGSEMPLSCEIAGCHGQEWLAYQAIPRRHGAAPVYRHVQLVPVCVAQQFGPIQQLYANSPPIPKNSIAILPTHNTASAGFVWLQHESISSDTQLHAQVLQSPQPCQWQPQCNTSIHSQAYKPQPQPQSPEILPCPPARHPQVFQCPHTAHANFKTVCRLLLGKICHGFGHPMSTPYSVLLSQCSPTTAKKIKLAYLLGPWSPLDRNALTSRQLFVNVCFRLPHAKSPSISNNRTIASPPDAVHHLFMVIKERISGAKCTASDICAELTLEAEILPALGFRWHHLHSESILLR
ncbi:hypothetical protein DFH27DRAFT_613391 [Peziza echinospora]|nr:hypothetical protein DFH27DRAFT_613391 [Peziza echinospora]